MVDPDSLFSLGRLNTDGHLALSLYLDVSTPDKRRDVMQRIATALEPLLAPDSELSVEQGQGLREDIEMVDIYFSTSASSRYPYVAIFSCAPQLFWRVVPLEVPVEETIRVGASLDTSLLYELLADEADAHTRQSDLLPSLTCASV